MGVASDQTMASIVSHRGLISGMIATENGKLPVFISQLDIECGDS